MDKKRMIIVKVKSPSNCFRLIPEKSEHDFPDTVLIPQDFISRYEGIIKQYNELMIELVNYANEKKEK